jgi:hypothetical protein
MTWICSGAAWVSSDLAGVLANNRQLAKIIINLFIIIPLN